MTSGDHSGISDFEFSLKVNNPARGHMIIPFSPLNWCTTRLSIHPAYRAMALSCDCIIISIIENVI